MSKRIAENLSNRQIFITGSTGFLAKVFVEKLLASLPDIGGLHLLIRPRSDGTNASERLIKEVKNSSVFDRLRGIHGDRFDTIWDNKVKAVAGDLTKPKLGLSNEDYEALSSTISLVVNSAATVTFDDRLDTALSINTRGPQNLLQLAKDAGNCPYMQVSTCYVCGKRRGPILEDMSPPVQVTDRTSESLLTDLASSQKDSDYDAERIVREAEALSKTLSQPQELIDGGMKLALSYGWNDTYTMTKWLGEQLIEKNRGDVPVVFLRPAIIESSMNEPQKGWIDGLRMADPLVVAYGRGNLKAFPGDEKVAVDLIPVDMVANAMICALPCEDSPAGSIVYHVGSSGQNPLFLKQLTSALEKAFKASPMDDGAGNPIIPEPFLMESLEDFIQRLDRSRKKAEMALAITGKPLMRLLVDQARQFAYFAKIYAPYTNLDCRFQTSNLKRLIESLHEDDRILFPCDPNLIDWEDYIINCHIPGIRRYVLGDWAIPCGSSTPHSSSSTDLSKEAGSIARDAISKVKEPVSTAHDIWEAVLESAIEFPAKTALQMRHHGKWLCYSYEELIGATACIVKRFMEFDLKPGDRISLCSENCPQWGLTYLAAMRYGLTVVPLDPTLPFKDIQDCTTFTDGKLIVGGEKQCERLLDSKVPVISLDSYFMPAPGLYKDVKTPDVKVSADSLASILFTSGTTVAPKAVPLSHSNFLYNSRALKERTGTNSTDRFLSLLPLYHAFEFTIGFLTPLLSGSTITYVDELKGPVIFQAMRKVRPTLVITVPRLLKLFIDGISNKIETSGTLTRTLFSAAGYLSRLSGHQWKKQLYKRIHDSFGGELKYFVCGGAPLSDDIYKAFNEMGFTISYGYGLTETSPVISSPIPGSERPGSSGNVLPQTEVSMRNQTDDGIGELWVRGPGVMEGYYKNDSVNREVIKDGWLCTGDLGRIDDEGHLYITGRVKNIIISPSGKNVYPEEVELRYSGLPHVKEFSVFGQDKDNGTGESVEAVIVVQDLNSNVKESIIQKAAEIAKDIPPHQRIQRFHFWTRELPKTSTMKVRRQELRDIVSSITTANSSDDRSSDDRSSHDRSSDDSSLLKAQSHSQAFDKDDCLASRSSNERESPGEQRSEQLSEKHQFVITLLSRLSERPAALISKASHLLLDLGLDSLSSLNAVAEIEAEFKVICPKEKVMSLTWVSDLLDLADQAPSSSHKNVL